MNRAVQTDIDIDFADREKALEGLAYTAAVMESKGAVVRHTTGVYFQDIPVDPITGYSSLDHEEAAELGYFKVDFLNNHIYESVRDEAHLEELVEREPEWDLFLVPEVVSELAHIHSHFGIVQSIKPESLEDLAVVLALMRPGKRHLVGKDRAEIDAEIWKPDPASDGYSFRKSHSYAYALSIVVQLNLLCDRIASEIEMDAAFDG